MLNGLAHVADRHDGGHADQYVPTRTTRTPSTLHLHPVQSAGGDRISLVIYDMTGREVKTLIGSQQMGKGPYQVEWDGTNNAGTGVASGIYSTR
jgi:flagellar hook assembly protein FlgD